MFLRQYIKNLKVVLLHVVRIAVGFLSIMLFLYIFISLSFISRELGLLFVFVSGVLGIPAIISYIETDAERQELKRERWERRHEEKMAKWRAENNIKGSRPMPELPDEKDRYR